MIRYTVVWHDAAQDQLTDVWLNSAERLVITQAAHAIDIELSHDPELKGIAAEGTLRELEVPPLRVLFASVEPDRLVKIVHVERA